ncbi:hypothetical protein I4U23_008682 [Adineta vaga]|nr:hypothetical protein I4U23_008682 [Adineta vaga]
MLTKQPFHWHFPDLDFFSSNIQLSTRQHAAIFIHNLCTQLDLPHYCFCTAATFMHRFLKVQLPAAYELIRLCQASILLACKIEDNPCYLKDICNCTSTVLQSRNYFDIPKVLEFHRNAIIDHENILLSTLGFAHVHHPHPIITKLVNKFKELKEFQNDARYLATESILITPFCLKYSANLIACFCIQLILEIKNYKVEIMDKKKQPWFKTVDESFTKEQIQNLINEFCDIMILYPNESKIKMNGQERQISLMLSERVSIRTGEIQRTTAFSHISNTENGSLSVTSKIMESSSMSTSVFQKEAQFAFINQSAESGDGSKSFQDDDGPSQKRRRVSSTTTILHNLCIISNNHLEGEWDILQTIYKKPPCNTQATGAVGIREALTIFFEQNPL